MVGRQPSYTWSCRPSEFSLARDVALAATRRLLAHPAQERLQLRRLPQLLDRRIQPRQRRVGVGRVDHAVTLRTKQLDIVAIATLLPWQAVVAREATALKG